MILHANMPGTPFLGSRERRRPIGDPWPMGLWGFAGSITTAGQAGLGGI